MLRSPLAGLLFVLLSGFKVNSLGTWKGERKKSTLNVDAQPVFFSFFYSLSEPQNSFIFALFVSLTKKNSD